MQTFLPYADYAASAATLDQKRLGKQRVEAYQALLQLCSIKMVDFPEWEPRFGGWSHPAMAMWSGHEVELLKYIEACCNEWTSRGSKDTVLEKSTHTLELAREKDWSVEPPHWMGDPEVHRSHRSNLVRKDPEHYGPLFPDDGPELEYIWPSTEFPMKERKIYNFNRMTELKETERFDRNEELPSEAL